MLRLLNMALPVSLAALLTKRYGYEFSEFKHITHLYVMTSSIHIIDDGQSAIKYAH